MDTWDKKNEKTPFTEMVRFIYPYSLCKPAFHGNKSHQTQSFVKMEILVIAYPETNSISIEHH